MKKEVIRECKMIKAFSTMNVKVKGILKPLDQDLFLIMAYNSRKKHKHRERCERTEV